MTNGHQLDALVVAIPCRDERATLGHAIDAVYAAARRVSPDVAVYVAVACDSSTDGSDQLAMSRAREHPDLHVVTGSWGTAGGARNAAVHAACAAASRDGVEIERCWMATTDADTSVPADWLTQQLAYAAAGADAVAGVVDLRDDDDHDPLVASLFAHHYPVHAGSHGHVHGANLGVWAAAYQAVGGFQPVEVAEDHLLWNALLGAGYACVSSLTLRVATSARLFGRAPGGFADTLRHHVAASGRPA